MDQACPANGGHYHPGGRHICERAPGGPARACSPSPPVQCEVGPLMVWVLPFTPGQPPSASVTEGLAHVSPGVRAGLQ